MKRSIYREQDYAFGQTMLTLRTAIGLTQQGLADTLGVSRRSVADWEAGSKYPKADRLKRLIGLAIAQHAFHPGHEVAEIRALWQAARQKTQMDELWLADLLAQEPARPGASPTNTAPLVDWQHAPTVAHFYGREQELALLTQWVVAERCRVVSVLGLGGIGKSALSIHLMQQIANHFDVVIWRSLRDAPTCAALLDDCLNVLATTFDVKLATDLNQRLDRLLDYLRERRVLLVLDNLETLLAEGEGSGRMLPAYAAYETLLRRAGERDHQSCLLLTSREKPSALVPLEGTQAPVRTLRLAPLEAKSCEHLLAEKGVTGLAAEQARLIDLYAGNPLALKIVAQTIVDLFDGELALFLAQGEIIFGSVRTLLAEQFARLAFLEQSVLLWLAILRDPCTLDELAALFARPVSRARLLEAMEALHRRSLIERGEQRGSFTLQSVVLEYATERLLTDASDEIHTGKLARLIEHGLELAHVREHIRQTQEHLLLAPILTNLPNSYQQHSAVEERLLTLLRHFGKTDKYAQGYGPANLVNLLRLRRGHLCKLDLSHLTLRGMYLQGIEMQDTSLKGAIVVQSSFTDTFDSLMAVTSSPTGEHWAAASRRGEVLVWTARGQTLHKRWRAHTARIGSLVFSPDGNLLASGSWDGTVKLWEMASGKLLWTGRHTSQVNRVVFSPSGTLLASGGGDANLRLWEVGSGRELQTLAHPGPVSVVAWSPSEKLLASGDRTGVIRLWQIEWGSGTCVQMHQGHSAWIEGLAFAPDGKTLASASYDGTIKLWDLGSWQTHKSLFTQMAWRRRAVWSPDGRILATCSFDRNIYLWDGKTYRFLLSLHEHTAAVYDLAFTSDSNSLLSVSEDGALRVWDVSAASTLSKAEGLNPSVITGQGIHVMRGYTGTLYDVDWNSDHSRVASMGSDGLINVYTVAEGALYRSFSGNTPIMFGISWRADGRWLAASKMGNLITLWDMQSGDQSRELADPDNSSIVFYGVAWRPDGQRLAAGTSSHGALVWDVTTARLVRPGTAFPTRIRFVAWSPDGEQLAGGGDNGIVYVWDANNGALRQQLTGNGGMITGLAWSPAGTLLGASASGKEHGEIFIWDPNRGEHKHTLGGDKGTIHTLAWGASNEVVISGGDDGKLRWWDVAQGTCVHVRLAHEGAVQALRRTTDGTTLASCGDDGAIMLWDLESGSHLQTLRRDRPYERMDITGLAGITDAQRSSLLALGAIVQSD